jgi:hypothetical protein
VGTAFLVSLYYRSLLVLLLMTLFAFWGLYAGWDMGGHPHIKLRIYSGSAQLQVGLLLLGCDWFYERNRARIKQSIIQGKDG